MGARCVYGEEVQRERTNDDREDKGLGRARWLEGSGCDWRTTDGHEVGGQTVIGRRG